ncbi:MAG: YbaN family protein [Pseudomonadota bacterium]
MRLFWLGLGWLAVGLGAIGAVLPLLPTVPFLLLAAFCFARSSDRFHKWLVEHPRFGPPIQDWRERGAIRRRVKWMATASMAASLALPFLMPIDEDRRLMILMIQSAAMIGVATFIWTRPES